MLLVASRRTEKESEVKTESALKINLVVGLLTLALCALAAPAQAVVLPDVPLTRNSPGLNTPGELAAQHEPHFGRIASGSHAAIVRFQVSGPSEKAIARVKAMRARGIKVLPVLLMTPWWTGDPTQADVNRYQRNVGHIVHALAPLGVHHWEVWNEPDLKAFWPRPDPAQFVRFLKVAYPTIKRWDPNSTVITGGVTDNNVRFIEGIYRAGGRPYFDAVGTHVYPRRGVPASCPKIRADRGPYLCGVREVYRTMQAHGDSGKKVWLTEWGRWVCGSAKGCVSPAVQADWVTRGFAYLGRYPFLKASLWFSDYDYGEPRLYGLRDMLLRPRPGYARFRAVADAYRKRLGAP